MIPLAPLVTASKTVRPSKGGRKSAKHRPDGPLSACEILLPSLVAHGFCVPALCELLFLEENELRSMLARHGLAATGTRVLRKSTAPGAWTLLQMQWLLVFWSTNLFATCIAERLGRSAGSVRYKARALGLPVRDRAALTRTAPESMPALLPPTWRPWSEEDEIQLGEEHLRGVCTESTAARLRRGHHHVRCTLRRLELPPRYFMRGHLKTEYNPADPYLEPFRDQDWRYRKCALSPNRFWGPKDGPRISNEFKKTQAYQDLTGGLGEAASNGY